MADIAHYWGQDISSDDSGDFLLATGVAYANQRVLRRLLTSPGEYVWHAGYGAGLPKEIGHLVDSRRIEGLIREHLALEAVVSRDPLPTVSVTQLQGGVFVQIGYTEAVSQQRSSLQFELER
jgi:hypothetical protein